jgi:hypothetical protein
MQGQRIRQTQHIGAGAAPIPLRTRLVMPRRAEMRYLQVVERENSDRRTDRARRAGLFRRELKSLLAFVFAAGVGFGAAAAVLMSALLD